MGSALHFPGSDRRAWSDLVGILGRAIRTVHSRGVAGRKAFLECLVQTPVQVLARFLSLHALSLR